MAWRGLAALAVLAASPIVLADAHASTALATAAVEALDARPAREELAAGPSVAEALAVTAAERARIAAQEAAREAAGRAAAAAEEAAAQQAASDAGDASGGGVALDDYDELELELDERPVSFPDPLESFNRRTLSLNQTLDRWLVSPVARAYGYVVPDPAKRSVRRFFTNLESPAVFVNDVLQGEMGDAATTVARFSVNTVIGIGGLFDPASSLGLPGHDSDFGETLARNGVGSGPFLIVPFLGPTTVRDGIGSLVDVALQPAIYLLGPAPLVTATVQEGTYGLTLREVHGDDLERLQQGSLDYYAALRSAYYQDRMADLAAASEPVPSVATGEPELVATR